MWFLGLVVGGLIGSQGGFGLAVLGAILGTIFGSMLGANMKSDSESDSSRVGSPTPRPVDIGERLVDLERKIEQIYHSLGDIHRRLVALEKPQSQGDAAPNAASAADQPAAQGESSKTIPDPLIIPVASAVAVDAANSSSSSMTIEEALAIDSMGASAATTRALSEEATVGSTQEAGDSREATTVGTSGNIAPGQDEPDRTWLVGLFIGATIGLTHGFLTAVLGGLVGAIGGMALAIVLQMRRAEKSRKVLEPAVTQYQEPPTTEAASRREESNMDVPAATASVSAIPVPENPVASAAQVSPAAGQREAVLSGVEPADSAPAPATAPAWWQRLFEGNIVAKVGAVILFFGVGFLLKFAYDHTVVPIYVRLLGVGAAGCAMIYGGWWLRDRRRLYGLILQGAGIGVLYVDVFFALKIFTLIHPTIAFALFMVLGVVATLLAVRQDSRTLAVLGLTGAFLAPVIANSGSGQHVLLFSYYTLLNSFILAISWFKSWRGLNLTGFIFTFIVGVAWGAQNYRPEIFGSVEPFVLVFFAMYLVIPILFASRQPPQLKGIVDATLVFGTPLSVAFMQASLVRDMPYGLAWSAGCGAALYAVLAFFVIRRESMRLLGETYIALSVVLATLAIFFALDAYPTFALWSLEGAAIVWVGLRQQRVLARAFGLFVQLAGAGYFLMHYKDYELINPWFNDFTLGCALVFFASTLTAWLVNRYREVVSDIEATIAFLLLIWGCIWGLAGGLHAMHYGVSADYFPAAALMLFGLSALAAEFAGARLRWSDLRKITSAHLVLMTIIAAQWFMRALSPDTAATHPLAQDGFLAWPINFGVLFWSLHRQMRDGLTTTASPRYYGGWLLMALLATWMATWLQMREKYEWAMVWGALGIGIGWVRYRLRESAQPEAWPISVAALGWGSAFWFLPGLSWLHTNVEFAYRVASGLGFATASAVAFEFAGSLLGWAALRRAQSVLLVAMAAALAAQYERHSHPFADYGLLAWAAAFGALFIIRVRHVSSQILIAGELQLYSGLAILAAVMTWEVSWLMEHAYYGLSWLMGLAVLIAAYWQYRRSERDNAEAVPISMCALVWALAVWLAAGWQYVGDRVPSDLHVIAGFAYVVISAALFEAIGSWLRWNALRQAQVVLPVFMAYTAAYQFIHASHPFADYGWIVWPAAYSVFYILRVRQERNGIAVAASVQRLFSMALLAIQLTWEAVWLLTHHDFELAAVLGFAAIVGAYLRFHLRERNNPGAPAISAWALAWGLAVWLLAGLGYVDEQIAPTMHIACGLGWLVLSCALAEFAGTALKWNALRAVEILLMPAMAVAFMLQIAGHVHPASDYAGIAWLAAFLALYATLYRQQRDGISIGSRIQHLFAIWMGTGLIAWEAAWQFQNLAPASSGAFAMWGLMPSMALWAIARFGRHTWPWREEFGYFRRTALAPIAVYCVGWSLLSTLDPSNTGELPYVPLLNPVDMAQGATLFAIYTWLRAAGEGHEVKEHQLRVGFGVLGFIWVNSVVLRSIHHWFGVAYTTQELFNSIVVQAAFSLVWTLSAMLLMIVATKKMDRRPWFIGAALLAVVVGKLFLLDLVNSGTVARIVSFLGVGVLLMIIGYVAPVPPGDTEKQQG